MKNTLKNISKKNLNNTFKSTSFYIYFMIQKMYLFDIDFGYTCRCSIRICNNKKAKKFEIDITSREFGNFNIVTLN